MLHPPTAYSRSLSGELVAELTEMNPYRYGIKFPPQFSHLFLGVTFGISSVMFFQFSDDLRQHHVMHFQWLAMPFDGLNRRQGDCDGSLYLFKVRARETRTRPHTRMRRLPLGSRRIGT
jgi:hypothetical protein